MDITTRFEQLINTNGGIIEKLPPNCKSSHIFKMNNKIMPLKLYIESTSCEWNLNSYDGIVILYLIKTSNILIIHTSKLNTKRTRSLTINIQYSNLLRKINDVVDLQQYIKDYSESIDNIITDTKYNEIPRSEILETRKNTNELEADGYDEIYSLIPEMISKTVEKCRADAGFYINNDLEKCIGIQIKTATLRKNGIMNVFHNCANYNNLLLFCRPMSRLYIGTVVIPGNLIISSSDIGLTFNDNSKYGEYIIPEIKMKQFMIDLFEAIIINQKEFIWPSGKIVDISSLTLFNFNDLCIPQYISHIKEYNSNKWRKNYIY